MNAKQIVIQMLNNNPNLKNNPMMQNALSLMQKNDAKGLEELANNLASSKGMTISDIKSKLGL